MKKTKALLFLLLSSVSTSIFAQHILSSSVLYQGEVHTTTYIFVASNNKDVEKDWKTYLSKAGKVSEEKGEFSVNIESSEMGRDLEKMVSYVQDYKSFSSVNVILLDENNRSLAKDQINYAVFEKFLYEFYDLAFFNEEVRMAETDLALYQTLADDAQKDHSRAERALAANLKAQEKLGKKLTETPEKLSQIIQDKDDVYQELLQKNGSGEVNEDDEESMSLQKEMNKQDRRILKTKSTEERNNSKLAKKEAEFPELTAELFKARDDMSKANEVLVSKKVVLQDLQKK
ncbi:MAG: hypothetical protein ACI9IP_000876 [Arcticibacterium sp.]|jgi:hypothetical protein